jgi:hypothetical protein
MIVYDVKCHNGHIFTGWFRNSDSFDTQAAAGEIACAECGDIRVMKAIMAPNLASARRREEQVTASPKEGEAPTAALPAPAAPTEISAVHAEAAVMQQLRAMRHAIESQCDYVGERFPEEARKIHYGETESRGIYGEATERESQELADEGIEIGHIPWLPRSDN